VSYKINLRDVLKGYTQGLDKQISPEMTVRLFQERLRQIDLNILEETIRIDNGRLDIPVYFSICGRDAEAVTGTKKQMGKGGSPAQAEASAVMELAERFSLFSFMNDPENFFTEKYRDITDRTVIPFEDIARSVHDDSSEMDKVEESFSDIPLRWCRAYNLTEDKEILIPFDWFYAINQFNGSSAGNCTEEAILQGICEVVERHVSALISLDRLAAPSIDPDSITDPVALELVEKFHKAGIKLYLNDFSMDTGIPTIGALGYDAATFPEKSEIVWTAGTTPDPQKALIRALTEVAQLAGDFNSGSKYVPSGLPKFRDINEAGFVTDVRQNTRIDQLADISHDNIKVEVKNCLSALAQKGMDVIVLDVTHPELKIPAYYIIVPGAHFRERAANSKVALFTAKLVTETEIPLAAINKLKKMDTLLSGRYYLKFYLGRSYLALERQSEAVGYFRDALELEPNREDIPAIYSYLGICLKDLGQYREAIYVLKKAEEYDSERIDIPNLMGFCYFKEKEHQKAIECFQKVIEIEPGSAIDYANIASNYRDMGNIKEAIRYYKLALELDSSIDFAVENLQKLRNQ
jgi:ribosomal protein S12 methylthiotransferase accessory factor